MSWFRKREIPIAIFGVTFLISSFSYFLDVPYLATVNTSLFSWILIISNFALGVGLLSMIFQHTKIVSKKSKGYPMSIILFSSLILMLAACFYSADSRMFWYSTLYSQLDTAILSLSSFYQFSAIYFAFRIRRIEAIGFLIGGIALTMYNAPVYGVILPGSVNFANWLLNVPAMGASRSITIGLALGTIALAIRMLLGREKSYQG